MKIFIKIQTALIALLVMGFVNCYAQTSDKVESIMNEIVKKHDGKDGVTCLTVEKGSGLNLVKMMFKKELGRDFMKGVNSITLIEYSDASAETCKTLHKDLDAFLSHLKEFDVNEEKTFSDNNYTRCFASISDEESGTISDFVIAMEDDKSKLLVYMAGTIKVE